ncbi:MAG: DUF123 domain-containing protein [Methanotrichaceae archaeon]
MNSGICNLDFYDTGIYTLILRLDREREICVGSLGMISFMKGYFAYTGSARGPGGVKRVKRHLDVLAGLKAVRRWHIDYLLPNTSFEDVVMTYTAQNFECAIARRIGDELESIPGFGCTDCRCKSHLHFSTDIQKMHSVIEMAHSSFGPNISTHNTIDSFEYK